MNHCKIVEDLWPLYLDGTLSEESRAFVEGHIRECPECSKLRGQGDGPELSTLQAELNLPGSPESLFRRLRRRWRRLVAVALLGVLLVGAGAWYASEWKAKQSYRQQSDQEQQAYFDKLAALEAASPSADELLSRLPICFALEKVEADQTGLTVDYSFTWPNSDDWRVSQDHSWFSQDLIIDSAGRVVRLHGGSGTNNVLQGRLQQRLTSGPLPDGDHNFVLKTRPLYLHMPVDVFSRDFDYSGSSLDLTIDQEINVNGIEFMVHSLQADGQTFKVYYSQTTPVGDVGVWQLTFVLNDRIGHRWGADGEVDLQVQSPKVYESWVPHSLSKHWRLELSHAVQVVPGIVRTVSLEGGR